MAFSLTASNIYVSSLLSQIDWLEHGFGTSSGNPVREGQVASLTQTHSDAIHHITGAGEKQAEGDGMFTSLTELWLSIRTADCIPILLVDPRAKVIAAVHAGWRGTVDQILAKTVTRLTTECHCLTADLLVAIGPGISACCFEVGSEVADQFESAYVSARPAGKVHIDLKKANVAQLMQVGVKAGNVDVAEACTVCTTGFHSYRGNKTVERMNSAIKIKRGAV